jgi:DNA/RNA-binding domain of Phe-tRNA-synthetase-like protein
MIDDFAIQPQLCGAARLGLIQIDDVHVTESQEELKQLFQDLAKKMAAEYKDLQPGDIPGVKAVRALFHKTGLDPTRYRPSSESLLRRAVKDKGLYFINSAVDVVNYCSLRTLLPMGLYDAGQIRPPIQFRVAVEGETYQGIGRDMLHLANFPVLADADGPFGSPVSDSMRTRVTEACTRLFWVTFAPPDTMIRLDEFAVTMTRFTGGVVQASGLL